MTASNTSFKLKAISALIAIMFIPQAHAQLLDAARAKLESFQSGKTPKSRPLVAEGAVESWGNEMPFRGDEAQKRANSRLDALNRQPGRQSAELRSMQRADERPLDDRFRDDRFGRSESDKRKETSYLDDKRFVDERPLRPSVSRKTVEERVAPKEPIQVERPRTISCENVSRAWEGAAAMAERGDEKRAYETYLRLLSTCNNEKDLVGTVFQAQKNLSADYVAALMQEPILESPKLLSAMFALKVQRMYVANKAKNSKLALELSRDIRAQVLESSDIGALEVSGWLEQRAKNPKAAEALFRRAIKVDKDADSPRQGLVFALLSQGKIEAASREADRLEGPDADGVRAEILLAQSRVSLKAEQYADALKQLQQAEKLGLEQDENVIETKAWVYKGLGDTDKSAKLFKSLVQADPENPDYVAGLVDSLLANRDDAALQKMAKETGISGDAAKEAIAKRLDGQGRRQEAAKARGEKVEGEAGAADVGFVVRSKSGDRGEGRLTEITAPVVAGSVKISDTFKVSADASRSKLDDGVRSVNGSEVRARVVGDINGIQVTAGAGASIVNGDTKPTFEVKAKTFTETGHIEAGISREPVKDSVRSYAGVTATEPVAGGGLSSYRIGRVMDTNAYVAGSMILSRMNNYKLDWNLGGGSVQGLNSYNNGYYRAYAQVTKDIQHPRFSWLNVGPYVQVQSYERDENRFDGKYGGYFSPKSDVGLGVVGNLLTKEGERSLYKFSGKMGYVSRGLHYGNDSGISAEGTGEAAWLVSDHLILGAGISLKTSPGYTDLGFKLGVQIPFEKRTSLFGSDLKAFQAIK